MMLFQDGSIHRWIGALDHDLNLIITLDDATSRITPALLIEEEGTMSSFVGLSETIEAYGLLGALYTDRGSHYFHTPEAGKKVDKTHPTQVGRALGQLGIRHIPSYSPQARGRMERVFGTLKQRLGLALTRRSTSLDLTAAPLLIVTVGAIDAIQSTRISAAVGPPWMPEATWAIRLAARAWPFIPQPKSADIAALSRGRIGQHVEPRQDMTQHERRVARVVAKRERNGRRRTRQRAAYDRSRQQPAHVFR